MDDHLKEVLDANAAGDAELQRQTKAWEEANRKLDLILDSLALTDKKLDRLLAKLDKVAEHRARIANLEVSGSLQGRI